MGCNCDSQVANNCGNSTPIELIAKGAKGDAGLPGVDSAPPVLYNNHTDASDDITLNLNTLKSYTLDNTPTPVMDVDGDYLKIETYYTVGAGVSVDLSLVMGATTIATINVVTVVAKEIKLWAIINRTGAATQQIEGFSETLGLPSSIVSTSITGATENLALDSIVSAVSQKTVSVGAADITCEYLRITLFETV